MQSFDEDEEVESKFGFEKYESADPTLGFLINMSTVRPRHRLSLRCCMYMYSDTSALAEHRRQLPTSIVGWSCLVSTSISFARMAARFSLKRGFRPTFTLASSQALRSRLKAL